MFRSFTTRSGGGVRGRLLPIRNDISESVGGDDVLDHELATVFHETHAFELVPHRHSSPFQYGQTDTRGDLADQLFF
jgi:hypothetical protein